MSQNDDHIEPEAEDSSETLDSTKPLYELGSRIGGYHRRAQCRSAGCEAKREIAVEIAPITISI